MSLVRNLAFVDNKWVAASSGKTFEVTNPADGKVVGQVPDMDTQDTDHAINAAHEAFKTWEFTTAKVTFFLFENLSILTYEFLFRSDHCI